MKANPLKSALASAGFTFVGLFAASALQFIGLVVDWANNGGDKAFPAMGGLAFAAVAAAGAAATGLVTFVIRWAQTKDYIPGQAPLFVAKDESGQIGAGSNLVWLVVGVLLIIVLIIWLAPHIN